MNITSITPAVVYVVREGQPRLGEYIRIANMNWMIAYGDAYESVLYETWRELEEAFQKKTAEMGGKLILQRRLKHPGADGSTPGWHDHPDMFFGELVELTEDLKEKLSAPDGIYLCRVVRKHYEVVWEGGEE